MEQDQAFSPNQRHVRAVFETSVAFFDMSRVATFEELADRLCSLGERHTGPLTRIELVSESPRNSPQALSRKLPDRRPL